ncbi:DEAD/DEAH box helicase [Akkermansiaceae bacterium]|nr:DEAD/DEAH box helicase [Akkermansiaceae bacterium]
MSEIPDSFEDLNPSSCPFLITNSLCDPVLLISIDSCGSYTAQLTGKVFKKGESVLLPVYSWQHDWVCDNEYIYPLPSDSISRATELLSNFNPSSLTYPEVLEVKKNGEARCFEIRIDEAILEKASTSSLRFSLESPPVGLRAEPYPYQNQGIAWMRDTLQKTNGLVLADEMGLGKTLQIIALLLLERPTLENPALIVCPTSLLANWGLELNKFAPDLSWRIHRGNDRARIHTQLNKSEILLTTYETLVGDEFLLGGIEWSYLICDEAQAIKNPDSQRRKATQSIRRKYTIPLTGTPVETSLADLWSLCDVAIEGLLGPLAEFIQSYPDNYQSAELVSEITDPIILKRRLADVAEQLPTRTNINIPLDLEGRLARGYEDTRQLILDTYKDAAPLVASGQLSLFCAHPWLSCKSTEADDWEDNVIIKKAEGYELKTPKVEACIDILKNAFFSGRKVIIFAAYNQLAEMLYEAAELSDNVYWNVINGSTPAEDRQRIVDDFSNFQGDAVLILNPKAAGAGLNIQAATVVIHYTQYWNPALEAQASARAHRTGQANPVSVYYLFYTNSVEEVMISRTEFRRNLAEAAIAVTDLDDQDICEALSITPIKS